MINNLNEENDKLDMINKIIKPINNKISYFFKSDNNKAVEKNLINIDGFWGSGKSTIVNNLEHYYQYKNDIEKPKFLIINLWEYETCPNPYDELLKSVFYGIFPHNNNNLQKKEKIWVKWWSRIKRNRRQVESIDHDFYYIIKNDFSHKIGYKLTKHFTDLNDKIDDWIQKIKNNIQEKIVIIFDEIDRCTVDNQIIFLSYIKNIFFKITNIFFIVSSNNEVINQNIIKEYCKTDSKREKYTEKIFNNTINLTNIFPIEVSKFTQNKYINDFRNKIKKITNISPRQMNTWLKQVNEVIKILEKDKDFKFLDENKNNEWFRKNIFWKIEFIIFYCYYIKNQDSEYYSTIININSSNIVNSNFFILIKEKLISKIDTQNVFDEDLVSMILNTNTYHYPGLSFKFNWKDSVKDDYYMYNPINFSASIPFLSTFLNEENIDKIFIQENDVNQDIRNNIDKILLKPEKHLFKFNLNNKLLNLSKHSKLFFELIMIGHPANGSPMRFDHIIKLDNVCKIIENSIFDN